MTATELAIFSVVVLMMLLASMMVGAQQLQSVTVTYRAATEYEPLTITNPDGTTEEVTEPLPRETSWTFISQYFGICPTDPAEQIAAAPIDGKGRWNGVPLTEMRAVFTQDVGTCACYEARTIVWNRPENYVSRAARAEKCIQQSTCSGCHSGG